MTGVRCGRFSRRRRRRFARPVHGRVRPPSISYRIYCSTARIWVSVRPGRFRLAGLRFASRTPIESPLTPRVRGDSHAPLTRRSTAQYAPIPPSYSDKPGTATIVARGDGVARLRQSRASEVFGVRASDPCRRMGGNIVCGSQQALVVVFRHIGPLGVVKLSLIDSLLRVLFLLATDDRVATVR